MGSDSVSRGSPPPTAIAFWLCSATRDDSLHQPYQPPNVVDRSHSSRKRNGSLSNLGLMLSLSALCLPVVIGFVVEFASHDLKRPRVGSE